MGPTVPFLKGVLVGSAGRRELTGEDHNVGVDNADEDASAPEFFEIKASDSVATGEHNKDEVPDAAAVAATVESAAAERETTHCAAAAA